MDENEKLRRYMHQKHRVYNKQITYVLSMLLK